MSSKTCGLGFVSTKEETFEIEPLTRELQSLFLRDPASFGITEDVAQSIIVEDMYLVKKPKICCFFENLSAYHFTFTTLYSADKFSYKQKILELIYVEF